MRAGTDLPELRRTLVSALDRFQSQRRRVYLGTCLRMSAAGYAADGPMWNHGSDDAVKSINQMMREVAATYASVSVVNLDAYDPSTMTSDDLVHPNDAGHAFLANAFLRAIAVAKPTAR
jgi:lysophospholipase L1-like esterase